MKVVQVTVMLANERVAVLTLRPGEKVTALELERPTSFDAIEMLAQEESDG